MKIAWDAKRAYHNTTGLGNYSRTLINSLVHQFPEHEYFLFNPKPSDLYEPPASDNVHQVIPHTPLSKKFPSLWRSLWLTRDLKKHGIDIYHGLSHELPRGIEQSGIRSVVTIHDLIFEWYPEQFNKVDVLIYRNKFRHACRHADRIIAISEQTKRDIVRRYDIPSQKIDVCYQSCHPRFEQRVKEEERNRIRDRYGLPPAYFLYVGSIIERKNLLGICHALKALSHKDPLPLVVIGNGKDYKEKVKAFIRSEGLEKRVLFLSEKEEVAADEDFISANAFPAIYQMATAMIYPSFYEGFGLPVLEALWSRVPVITSSVSCLPEAGGPGAFYVHPSKPSELAAAMLRIMEGNESLTLRLEQGLAHARKFSTGNTAQAVMEVYEKLSSSHSPTKLSGR